MEAISNSAFERLLLMCRLKSEVQVSVTEEHDSVRVEMTLGKHKLGASIFTFNHWQDILDGKE